MTQAAGPLVAVACRSVLVSLVGLLTWSVLPALVGWQPYLVASGSMSPAVEVGDVVLADPRAREPMPGRVLVVDDPARPETALTHRVVDVSAGGIRLRGDANAAADAALVPHEAVRGTARLVVPAVGLPARWAAQGRWLEVGSTGVVLALLLLAARAPAEPWRHRPGPWAARSSTRDLRTAVSVLSAGLAVVLVAGVNGTQSLTAATFSSSAVTSASWGAASSFYGSAVRASGPAALWRLAETSGTVAADRTGARTGAYVGGVTLGGLGRVAGSSAARFDGANDEVLLGDTLDFAGTSPFTVELWLRLDAAGMSVPRSVISKIDSSTSPTRGWSVRVRGSATADPSTIEVRRWTGGGGPDDLSTYTAMAADTWYHLVVTYDGSTLRTFHNGAQQTSTASSGSVADTAAPLRIGAEPGVSGFDGSLSDVAVYTRALSDEEIDAHFAAQ